MQKFREILQRINRREWFIKSLVFTLFMVTVIIIIQYMDVTKKIIELLILDLISPTKYNIDFSRESAEILSGWMILLIVVAFGLVTLFIVSFRTTQQDFWRFFRRLFRAFYLLSFLIVLAMALFFVARYLTGIGDPDTSLFSFLGDMTSGLTTEILGAFLLFLLLEVFAKTWEENEEAEYAELRNDVKETHTQLEAILAQWQKAQVDYLQQAKQASEKSILNRLLSPQQMPSAYYEGQAQALESVIKDIQNLIAEPNTLPSDLVAEEVK